MDGPAREFTGVNALDVTDSGPIVQWSDGMKIEPGVLYAGLPNALYHKGPGISKSGLDLIRRSPMHYKFYKENPKPPTDALFFGQAFHALVLDGEDAFHNQYERFDMTRQSNAGKAKFQAIIDSGKLPIKGLGGSNPVWDMSDWDKLFRMRDSVLQHPYASTLLGSGAPEISGYYVDTGKMEGEEEDPYIRTAHGKERVDEDPTFKLCKFRMDWYNDAHNLIVDLKKTRDASYTSFCHSVIEYRYHVQDAWYRQGMRYIGWPVQEFAFIAVEDEPPFATAVYVITEDGKAAGRAAVRRDLATYLACKSTDTWPGYQERDGSMVRPLDLPKWAIEHPRVF